MPSWANIGIAMSDIGLPEELLEDEFRITLSRVVGRPRFRHVPGQGKGRCAMAAKSGVLQPASARRIGRAAAGFAAGFGSVLIFHQGMLMLLHVLGLTSAAPFSLQPTAPLGVPAVWSAAFWGGVWGILFALAERGFPPRPLYWIAAVLFGAIPLSLVGWFIVLPLKGLAQGGGWHAATVVTALLVNGAWGFGTGLLLGPHASEHGPN
jgi:hypothetical protein